ncbi:hypothetical protein VNO80_21886 [Phaseolus coccineus]|uniref:Uncharacterized protein n=1 Tax=Phaseolus coccineus TaxID=3886 RepID=A0AAN9M3V0_PHACN
MEGRCLIMFLWSGDSGLYDSYYVSDFTEFLLCAPFVQLLLTQIKVCALDEDIIGPVSFLFFVNGKKVRIVF